MKLRIRGDSIRLRLTRSEVEQLGRGESITETTRLADGIAFTYGLQATGEDALRASLSDGTLLVTAPADALAEWASGDEVELACANSTGPSVILVEKDFACLSPRDGNDDDDTFPHPGAGTDRC
ncbi:MAG: hypothetical protein AAGF72_14780 [Pseudomonadota bacterium]